MVEAVDDVEQRSLATFEQVWSLEERRSRNAVRLGSVVEVLDVAHRDETGRCFRVEIRRWQPSGLRQLVDQSNTHGSRKHRRKKVNTRSKPITRTKQHQQLRLTWPPRG